jgi:hypothetical protein
VTRTTIPTGLSPRARRLWRALEIYDFDPGEQQVRIQLVRMVTLADRISDELASAELTVLGSRSQPVESPLAAMGIKTADSIARLSGRLNLPDRDLAAVAASQLGKLGARRRWHHPSKRAS